jgi:cytochrome P450
LIASFAWRRITTKAVEIGGISIPAGAKLLLMTGSGNHDDSVFPEGKRFDVRRQNAKRHLALGKGAHYCMGAPLARLEMRVVLEELVRRLPQMTLVEGQSLD